ncbi:MAG: D-glycerate dehydrogenase [Chloroflexi bacterium]|nr:MAG: D-glycerate dehydrogenase [Chloroflexota bacterium]HEY73841.1 D-glycerate dehydrogenase [Thermoflexia bacterium]
MMKKVYVTRLVPDEGLDMLKQECKVEVWEGELPVPRDVLLEKVRDIDGLYCLLSERVDAELLAAAPHLQVVSNMAVGYDNIDVDACTARSIPVGNTPGVLTDATADCAFALLMAAARRIVEGADYVRAGRWKTWGPMLLMGQDVHAAVLGIVGLGRIGQAVARRARGFDMRVLYHDLYVSDVPPALKVTGVGLDTLLAESDFISLHVPLTEETYHLIGAGELRKCKPTTILVNTSRGGVVDADALYRALRDGEIAYAALDVTEPEPLPADHPLLSLSNCIVTPHIASASVVTRTRMAVIAAENLLAGLRGESLPHPVKVQ